MIPIQVRDKERTALELLKPALESALHDANIKFEIPTQYTGVRGFYEHNLKINKLAYAAIQEFDLPLVRTWYKYGQYEPYDDLRPKSLEIADRSSSSEVYVPSGLKTDVTQEDITNFLLGRDLKSTFEKGLFDFLIENYREWQPEPYTDTYVASTRVIYVLENLAQSDNENLINRVGDLRKELKQASIDLRYDLESIDTFNDEIHAHAEEYLTNLEDALITVDETSEVTDDQIDTIIEARKVYHEFVWPWAALSISIDRAEGPKESLKEFTTSGEDIIKQDKKSYDTYLTGWETELENNDLKPDLSQYQSTEYPAPEAVKKLQRAAIENN